MFNFTKRKVKESHKINYDYKPKQKVNPAPVLGNKINKTNSENKNGDKNANSK